VDEGKQKKWAAEGKREKNHTQATQIIKIFNKRCREKTKERLKKVANYGFLWKKFDSDNLCLRQRQVVILDEVIL
jgi:hypothetical protein